ncbi:MAG: cell division protein ZapA, partial [Lachnospiraceae bacterium]
MSKKTSADVLIGGRIYTLCGYESEEYLQKVANYINNKINEYDSMEKFRRLPMEMKTALVELNIADDYFKAREQAEKLDQDVKEKEKEIYELKHELISARIKVESSEKINAELEKENRKLLLHKANLEATLEA